MIVIGKRSKHNNHILQMFEKTRNYILVIFISFLCNSNVLATDPEIFVQSTVNRASKILTEDISKEKKMQELQNIAKDTVDIRGIGFYTLGPIRKTLNDENKKIYSALFEKYFLKTFSSRLAEYTNPEINVLGKEILNKNYTIVNSTLIGTKDRPEIKIDWRIYTKDPEKPLIRDLIIEGLSLARTQKEEFNSVLQSNNNDIKELFKSLESFIKSE